MVVLAKLYIDLIAIIPIIEYNILIMEVSIMEYLTATELSKVWNISVFYALREELTVRLKKEKCG